MSILLILGALILLAGACYSPRQEPLGNPKTVCNWRIVGVHGGYQAQARGEYFGWNTLGDGHDPDTFATVEAAQAAIARFKSANVRNPNAGRVVWTERS